MEKNELCDLVQFIRKNHPKCSIDIYYDKKNVINNICNLKKNIKNLDEILGICEKHKKNAHIFVRIHCFNCWTIVRIKVDLQQVNCIEKEIRNVFSGDLLNIVFEQQFKVIKLCYSES